MRLSSNYKFVVMQRFVPPLLNSTLGATRRCPALRPPAALRPPLADPPAVVELQKLRSPAVSVALATQMFMPLGESGLHQKIPALFLDHFGGLSVAASKKIKIGLGSCFDFICLPVSYVTLFSDNRVWHKLRHQCV